MFSFKVLHEMFYNDVVGAGTISVKDKERNTLLVLHQFRAC